MKTHLSLLCFFIISAFVILMGIGCSSARPSSSAPDSSDISTLIEARSFIFTAERMNPLRGRTRVLTTLYDVRVNNDSLISYLPYFGRAYAAPMDPTEVPTQFTSTNFTYETSQSKKTQWLVRLKPKDRPAIQELNFTIFDNGSATLNLISSSRDAISYSGYIKKIEN